MSENIMHVRELTADDRLEIAELFSNWACFEDSGNSEGWAGQFTTDGGYTSGQGNQVYGYDALLESSRARWAKPESRKAIHWFGSPLITATVSGAEASHYGMLIDTLPGGECRIRVPSIRSYTLCHDGGRWKIASRTIKHFSTYE